MNNALFHCVRNASMPEGLGEASARLPKGQWSTTMYTGDTLEFEDLMEKAVYVFENAAASKKITAVLARYQSNAAQSQPIVTCNFFLGADGLSDIGDFSEKHNEATGAKWYECVSY